MIGVSRGVELIVLCELRGLDAEEIVRTNAVIAGRPVLSHTRKSLIEARQAWVAQENGAAAAAAIAEEERYDDGVPFVRDVVFTPPEKMKEGTQLAKKLVSWMEDEGAVGVDYVVRPFQGEPVIMVKVPLDQVPALLS